MCYRWKTYRKDLVTPTKAAGEAVRWLERLERGEISNIPRRNLEVKISPVKIEKRINQYGDFTRLNYRPKVDVTLMMKTKQIDLQMMLKIKTFTIILKIYPNS